MIWWKLLKGFISDINSIERTLRLIKNQQIEMEAIMAVSRVEFNAKLNDLKIAVDSINVELDLTPEAAVVDAIKAKVDSLFPPPPAA